MIDRATIPMFLATPRRRFFTRNSSTKGSLNFVITFPAFHCFTEQILLTHVIAAPRISAPGEADTEVGVSDEATIGTLGLRRPFQDMARAALDIPNSETWQGMNEREHG